MYERENQFDDLLINTGNAGLGWSIIEFAENTRSLLCCCFKTGKKKKIRLPVSQPHAIMFGHAAGRLHLGNVKLVAFIVQELCES